MTQSSTMSHCLPTGARSLEPGSYEIAGAVDLEINDAGIKPWRLKQNLLPLFDDVLVRAGATSAGVRAELQSDTGRLWIDVDPCAEQPGPYEVDQWRFDLLVDGQLHERQTLPAEAQRLTFEGWPAGEHVFALYFEQGSPVRLEAVCVDEQASASPPVRERKRWVVYGSSITQSRRAAGPSEAWPASVANQFDLDLTCLGYGGNCKLEPTMGRMIAELPADLISLCLGINVINGDYSYRTFRAAAIGIIQSIRDRHPETPMVCVSSTYSPPREQSPGISGMTLEGQREVLAEVVDLLRSRGDANLHYVSGVEVFGPDDIEHSPDELHPNAEGYRILARQYAEAVMPKFGAALERDKKACGKTRLRTHASSP